MGPGCNSLVPLCLPLTRRCSAKTLRIWIAILGSALGSQIGSALPTPTTTTLALTSGGAPVATLVRGNVITLTATVTAGGSPVTPGQVDFCDASVSYCTDIRLLGTAQLLKSGVAQLKFVPGNGTHTYRAVFRGTNSYAPSSSASLPLLVAGTNASATQISSSGYVGNYTLSAIVGGTGDSSPTGDISFLNATNGNVVLGSATLVANPPGLSFVQASNVPVYLKGSLLSDDYLSPAAGDFNNDGLQDLVTITAAPWCPSYSPPCPYATAMAALGDGKGNFTAGVPTLDVDTTHNPLVADFDGDGNLDLVLGLDSKGLLAGNGDGTFSLKAAASSLTAPFQSWTTDDFNQDGIPDIALVTSNFVLIYRGNGDGTFSASTAAPTAISARFIVSGDFNNDGLSDLAVTSTSNAVTVLLGNGDETFKAAQTIENLPSPDSLLAADFNEDGKVDLAVSVSIRSDYYFYSDLAVTVLLGNGDGTFAPTAQSPIAVSTRGLGSESIDMKFGDFNSHASIAFYTFALNTGSKTCWGSVLFGNGDGTFGSEITPSFHGSYCPVQSSVADFNGDGRSDIAANGTVGMFSDQTALATINGVSVAPGSGSVNVIASFPGDSNYMPSTSTSTALSAAQGTPKIILTASPNPASYGSPVTLSVKVSGPGLIPTGTVNLLDGSASLTTVTLDSSGTATYVSKSLEMRTHSITATYAGDSNYTSATPAALTVTVTKPVPAVSVTSSSSFLPLGASTTFTATFTGVNTIPTGTVTFQDGSTQLAQVALNSDGVATYTTASLAEGMHTIVAAYGGDTTYDPVTSSSTQVVTSSKPFLAVSGTAVTIMAGAISGNMSTITITPQQGFMGSVALAAAVTSGPVGGQYPPAVSLGSSSVRITGTSPATAILTVSTTAPHQAAMGRPKAPASNGYEKATFAVACVLLFGIRFRRLAWNHSLRLLALLCVLFELAIACGGGDHHNNTTTVAGTTPGAYTITVTATAGPITQQGSAALTVQ